MNCQIAPANSAEPEGGSVRIGREQRAGREAGGSVATRPPAHEPRSWHVWVGHALIPMSHAAFSRSIEASCVACFLTSERAKWNPRDNGQRAKRRHADLRASRGRRAEAARAAPDRVDPWQRTRPNKPLVESQMPVDIWDLGPVPCQSRLKAGCEAMRFATGAYRFARFVASSG
jgi:hypothetical protein